MRQRQVVIGSVALARLAEQLVRGQRQELDELVGERDLLEDRRGPRRGAAAPAAPPSPRRRSPARGRGSTRPWCIHCQTCEREISAVATSSIRLLIAAAPVPCSHAAMYWMPTETFCRTPASVTSPGVVRHVEQLGGGHVDTSGRCRVDLVRPLAEHARRTPPVAVGTRSGCATQVPSKPSPASRCLSSRTFASAISFTSGSRRLGMNAAMPPIAYAPRAVARLHEQLGVRAHERHGHRHERPVGQHEVVAVRGTS